MISCATPLAVAAWHTAAHGKAHIMFGGGLLFRNPTDRRYRDSPFRCGTCLSTSPSRYLRALIAETEEQGGVLEFVTIASAFHRCSPAREETGICDTREGFKIFTYGCADSACYFIPCYTVYPESTPILEPVLQAGLIPIILCNGTNDHCARIKNARRTSSVENRRTDLR